MRFLKKVNWYILLGILVLLDFCCGFGMFTNFNLSQSADKIMRYLNNYISAFLLVASAVALCILVFIIGERDKEEK